MVEPIWVDGANVRGGRCRCNQIRRALSRSPMLKRREDASQLSSVRELVAQTGATGPSDLVSVKALWKNLAADQYQQARRTGKRGDSTNVAVNPYHMIASALEQHSGVRMIYVLAVIAGIVGAVGGWLVTGALTAWVAGLYGTSDFEGARSMFAFLAVGPLGALMSMIASAWLVLRAGKGRTSVAPTLGRFAIVLGAIVMMVAAGVLLRLYTIDTYTNTAPPSLEFEIRVPAAMLVPEPSALRVELDTDKNVGESTLADRWVPAENDHKVLTGSVPLAFKTWSRLVVVSLPDQPTRLFRLPLSRDPQSTATLNAWCHADHIDVRGEGQPRAAPADDPVEMRYRVRRAGDD
jgi:hypothetical protein